MKKTNAAFSLLLLAIVGIISTDAQAAQHGFGIQASNFSPSEDETEFRFDIDSGPIPQAFYRLRANAHSVFVGVGSENWGFDGVSFDSNLDFVTIFGNYRYMPWHDKVVTLVVGGGLGWNFYDAEISSGAALEIQTGLMLAVEPLVGVEVRAHKSVRIGLDAKYSHQLFSTDDFEEFSGFTDIDMSGLYVSLSASFLFGD